MPVVGSSKNIILGFPMTLIATDNLLFIPPEKDPTCAFFTSSSPTLFNNYNESSSIISLSTPFILENMYICSNAVI